MALPEGFSPLEPSTTLQANFHPWVQFLKTQKHYFDPIAMLARFVQSQSQFLKGQEEVRAYQPKNQQEDSLEKRDILSQMQQKQNVAPHFPVAQLHHTKVTKEKSDLKQMLISKHSSSNWHSSSSDSKGLLQRPSQTKRTKTGVANFSSDDQNL